MNQKASKIINLPVITLNDGKKISTVNDIVFNPHNNKVEAFVVDPGGWFSDAKVIFVQDIDSVGPDAVIINSPNSVRLASDSESPVADIVAKDNYLTGKKVITQDGQDLGKVTDLYFDPKSGQVESLEVSQGVIQNLKSGKKTVNLTDIVTMGDDNLIVSTYTTEDFDQQSQSQGLKGALNSASDTLNQKFDQVKNSPKTHTLLDRTKNIIDQKVQEGKNTAQNIKESPQTQNLADAAKLELEKARKVIDSKADRIEQDINQRAEKYRQTHPDEDPENQSGS